MSIRWRLFIFPRGHPFSSLALDLRHLQRPSMEVQRGGRSRRTHGDRHGPRRERRHNGCPRARNPARCFRARFFPSRASAVARLRVIALERRNTSQYDPSDRGMFVDELLYEPALVTTPGGQWGTHAFEIRAHELAHADGSRYIDLACSLAGLLRGSPMGVPGPSLYSDRNEFEWGAPPPTSNISTRVWRGTRSNLFG